MLALTDPNSHISPKGHRQWSKRAGERARTLEDCAPKVKDRANWAPLRVSAVPDLGYSVLVKLRTAKASMTVPSVSTITTSSQIGTTQSPQVSGAASSPRTTRRMGSTP